MTDQNKPEDAIPVGESSAGPIEQPIEQPNDRASTSPRVAKAASGPSAVGSDELPYIDDPVSKWWIGIIVAVFALIFAWAILFGAGGLFDGILGSDDPTPSPAATLVATVEPEPTQVPSVAPAATDGPALPSAEPESTQAPGPTGTAAASEEPSASPEG